MTEHERAERLYLDPMDDGPQEVHTPFTDDGVTYCGWDLHEGCGEVWPCATIRERRKREERTAQKPRLFPTTLALVVAYDAAEATIERLAGELAELVHGLADAEATIERVKALAQKWTDDFMTRDQTHDDRDDRADARDDCAMDIRAALRADEETL